MSHKICMWFVVLCSVLFVFGVPWGLFHESYDFLGCKDQLILKDTCKIRISLNTSKRAHQVHILPDILYNLFFFLSIYLFIYLYIIYLLFVYYSFIIVYSFVRLLLIYFILPYFIIIIIIVIIIIIFFWCIEWLCLYQHVCMYFCCIHFLCTVVCHCTINVVINCVM